jgi:hypothetical protein
MLSSITSYFLSYYSTIYDPILDYDTTLLLVDLYENYSNDKLFISDKHLPTDVAP